MIPFVVATSLASSSPLYLENESQITENVSFLVKTFFWKSVQNELCKNVANEIVGSFLMVLLDSKTHLLKT